MTPTQARYLAFIQKYIDQYGIAPSENEMARAMCVMPPSVNQMMTLVDESDSPKSLNTLVWLGSKTSENSSLADPKLTMVM